jgi:hypothetical protein
VIANNARSSPVLKSRQLHRFDYNALQSAFKH